MGFVGVNGGSAGGAEDMGFALALELEGAGGPIDDVVPLRLGFVELGVTCGGGGA